MAVRLDVGTRARRDIRRRPCSTPACSFLLDGLGRGLPPGRSHTHRLALALKLPPYKLGYGSGVLMRGCVQEGSEGTTGAPNGRLVDAWVPK